VAVGQTGWRENSFFLKGTAFQAVRNCFAMNSSLAAEGWFPLITALFPHPLIAAVLTCSHGAATEGIANPASRLIAMTWATRRNTETPQFQ
jgi:hypothetical protein